LLSGILLNPISLSSFSYTENISEIEKIKKEVLKYEDSDLIFSIIRVESNFNPRALSKKGARGLTQIRPAIWHKELKEKKIIKTKEDYFKIENNVAACNYILTSLKKKYKHKKIILQKYSNDKNYYKKILKKERIK